MAEDITGNMNNIGVLADKVANLIYRQGKAKLYNILESQLGSDGIQLMGVSSISGGPIEQAEKDSQKLRACKRLVDDVLEVICHNVVREMKEIK